MIQLTKLDRDASAKVRSDFYAEIQKQKTAGGVLLETCNRTEFYWGEGKVPTEIVRHLFRVASGLDSAIIGETAIVGQVKNAYLLAATQGTLHKNLHRLFQTALFVSKRVRTKTGISEGALSHSQATVSILLKEVQSIKNLNIVLIGANLLNEKILKFLHKKGTSNLFIVNRTSSKALELAKRYNATPIDYNNRHRILKDSDVIISATRAPHFIIKDEEFQCNHKILAFDLAAPPDIDPRIGQRPDVRLYNLQQIENHVQQNTHLRQQKVINAENIIEREIQIFIQKQRNEEPTKTYDKNG